MPEGLDHNGFTPEEAETVRKIFATSSAEYLSEFKQALTRLKQEEYADTVLEPLHRSIHSLKGAAMQLGFLSVGELALSIERLVKKVREYNPASIDYAALLRLLEAGEKRLLVLLDQISNNDEVSETSAGEDAGTSADLIAELDQFFD